MIPFAASALLCIVSGEENPFPAIGDAAYRKHVGGEPSHGHRQHAQKICEDRACGSTDILSDRQTDRQTYSSQYFTTEVRTTMRLTEQTAEHVIASSTDNHAVKSIYSH